METPDKKRDTSATITQTGLKCRPHMIGKYCGIFFLCIITLPYSDRQYKSFAIQFIHRKKGYLISLYYTTVYKLMLFIYTYKTNFGLKLMFFRTF